ncbi:MAG TPA: plastocyanin/azurin family copper-binding protein [Candidatus Limnocylindrales bacterium]|nr:plastocyanin/azurin family copper-binding protein [Candidatus Limnocylindrales bacterium]
MAARERYLFKSLVAAAALAFVAGGCTGATGSPTAPAWTYAPASAPASTAVATPASTVAATTPAATPEPALGFTPGTAASPRIIEVSTDDNLNFTPGLIQAVLGESVTFKVHNVGTATHEFMIGPLADAFADKEGTPEVADIGPGQTGELNFTFTGKGPFAFACHAPGHFQHGMLGYVQLVGPGAPTLGTKDNPRVVWMNMDDQLRFMPDSVTVHRGETIRFVLTNSGKVVHEFQVGVADKVAADDVDGVTNIEKDELDEGSTHAVEFTFDGPGPYAYACHEPGHYEAGMHGDIVIVES